MTTPLPALLRATRRARGLTQAEAGEQLGLDRETVGRIERKEQVPSESTSRWIRHWCECAALVAESEVE